MTLSATLRTELSTLEEMPYEARLVHAKDNFLAWSDPPAIETDLEYALYRIRRSLLSSAENHAFNQKDEGLRTKLSKRLSQYESAMVAYNRMFELPQGDDRIIARYLLWGRYFMGVYDGAAWLEARDRGVLRKKRREDGAGFAFYVVGLRYKVGDNVFTCDSRGREHRQYANTIGCQAIFTQQKMPFSGERLEHFAASVPDLDPTFHETDVGDHKHCVKPLSVTRKEKTRMHELLRDSRYADGDLHLLPGAGTSDMFPLAAAA